MQAGLLSGRTGRVDGNFSSSIYFIFGSDSLLLGTPRYCSCRVGSCHKNIDSVITVM